jgi:hypothetical protein
MFVGKARSLPYSEAFERYFIYVVSALTNIKLGQKGVPGTNTLAYFEHPQITGKKVL